MTDISPSSNTLPSDIGTDKQERILTILYDMASIMCGETRAVSLINKTLQRLMFHTGSSCGVFLSDNESPAGLGQSRQQTAMQLEAVQGESSLSLPMGREIVLPTTLSTGSAVLERSAGLASLLSLSDDDYPCCLRLPIARCGVFLLFFRQRPVTDVPVTKMFEPVLQNFSRVLDLCRVHEEYTRQLFTDREHAFAGLSRFRAALDATADNIFLIDPEHVHFLDFNRSAMEDLGYRRSELLALGLKDINPDLAPEVWQAVFQRMIEQSLRYKEILTVHQRRDGSCFPVEMRLNLLQREHDSRPVVIAVARDISDRVRSEHELQKHRQHLEELVVKRTAALTEANAELESFSYTVSHDLRAPLRAIEGFSDALLEDYCHQLDAQGLDYLRRIKRASVQMAELINDLLALSRVSLHKLDCCQISLSRLASEVINDLMEAVKDRTIEWRVEKNVLARADRRMLRIAFENLLNNSIKYSSGREPAVIEFGILTDQPHPVYYVQDNGVGFDMRLAGKLFTPFQRLHKQSEFPGSGIGLATVQRIIHHHGGEIWGESLPGGGARFMFTLP